jgi:hypothetical protein
MRCHAWYCIAAVCAGILWMTVNYGHAASVRQVTLNEMLAACPLVFEGRVTAVEAQEDSRGGRIHTYVTFEVQDVIKGEDPGSFITLRFLGGRMGDVTMTVSDMTMPRAGERGIYFVESLERFQAHPLYGWSQGHFIVVPDSAGTDRVMTGTGHPVTGIDGDVTQDPADSQPGPVSDPKTGVAAGVYFARENMEPDGLTPEEFKQMLRHRMRMGQ